MPTIDYSYLRPKKAEALKKRYDAEFIKRKSLSVWSGENAVVLPLKKFEGDNLLFGRGGVIDKHGQYVDMSAINKRVCGKYEFSNPQYDDSTVVYCGYLVNHWGHFLVEAVARLWYFLENDNAVDKYVFFIEENAHREIRGNYKIFLELLGIWNKIEIICTPTRYAKVIVPELAYSWRSYYSEQYKNIFQRIISNSSPDPSWIPFEKVYLSRSKLAKANGLEFGLDALDDFFERNGYVLLFPEQLPLQQLIFYIRNSKICASLSGSLPHNFLFAEDEQKVIIVERIVFNNEIQVDVNTAKNLDVTYIDANISLYSTTMSGPFILGYNKQLQKFAESYQMLPPSKKYLSKYYLFSCFKKYMKAYRKEYSYRFFMEDWYTGFADCIWEAYKESYIMFSDYLSGNKPFLPIHYFQWHYLKQFIKRILKR